MLIEFRQFSGFPPWNQIPLCGQFRALLFQLFQIMFHVSQISTIGPERVVNDCVEWQLSAFE